MSRSIDADKMIDGYSTTFPYDLSYCDDGDLMEWLNAQPTADVAEFRHGHWITEKEALEIDRYDLAFTCSVCGHCDWDCTESEGFNYCPNCGSKMDGERSKTDE